ncbi:hypothetical protein FZEAL_3327 [Fusarium zealandicum]|uniref:Uncharacterized protein n=1 Tax=Fusarium zealandicum TaxID=1053134 RepID=A0A8H4XN21_9HYPO|nr:hypothetical protein FZEAL_3327 [Fusarium zealandicum]
MADSTQVSETNNQSKAAKKETISLRRLYRLCILTNKYDATHTLRPMASHWFAHLRKRIPIYKYWSPELMFVAWEFGYSRELETMMLSLATCCFSDANGDLIDIHGKRLKDLKVFTLLPLLAECLWAALRLAGHQLTPGRPYYRDASPCDQAVAEGMPEVHGDAPQGQGKLASYRGARMRL